MTTSTLRVRRSRRNPIETYLVEAVEDEPLIATTEMEVVEVMNPREILRGTGALLGRQEVHHEEGEMVRILRVLVTLHALVPEGHRQTEAEDIATSGSRRMQTKCATST